MQYGNQCPKANLEKKIGPYYHMMNPEKITSYCLLLSSSILQTKEEKNIKLGILRRQTMNLRSNRPF